MVGVMKGLNDMKNDAGFKVGDIVRYIDTRNKNLFSKLHDKQGVVEDVFEDVFESRCIVKFAEVPGIIKTFYLYSKDLRKVETPLRTPDEAANDKDNVWTVVITPSPLDRERTIAKLFVNGRVVKITSVSRWHDEDEYDVGIASYEVIKKMFDIKDKAEEKVADNKVAPKWFNGKVVCVENSPRFTMGKIYDVVDGVLIADDGNKFCYFTDIDDMNSRMSAQFIEIVE